jgi:hypothetical protein
MAQRPIAVSKIVKRWSVMAGSKSDRPMLSLMLAWNLGLEIAAIHPDSGKESCSVRAFS